jgi:hypothetical protein
MIRSLSVILSLLMGLVTLPAMGQQQRGDIEAQLQGSFSTTVGADVTSSIGTIAGKFGPYITDNIQVGIGPTLTIATSSTTSLQPGTSRLVTTTETNVTLGTTAFVVYSFLMENARAVPYIGASFYKRDFSNGDEKGWIGANGGVKYFFTKKTAMDMSANYLTSLNPDTKGGLLLFAFGLSFLL